MAHDHDADESVDDATVEPAGEKTTATGEPRTPAVTKRATASREAPSGPRRAPAAAEAPSGRTAGGTIRTILVTILVLALGTVSVLLYLQSRTLDTERREAADRARAEQIASDYAVKAATMDYRDLTPWLNGVKAGTTPELSKKFDSIVDLMREVVTPLRLTSTGRASFAKTTSEVNGIYQVKVAVDVSMQNVQAPQGTLSTSTYSVTLDRNRDWVITEAGDPANPSAVLSGLPSETATPTPSAAPTSAAPPATESAPAPTAPATTPN